MRTARLLTVSSSIMGGGCLPRGLYPSMQWGRHPPPCEQNPDRCKNIALPQTSLVGGNYLDD